jgi:transcriptional regulator with XRE-family HTH domain
METGILVRISRKIKNTRKEKGLTIQEVANRAGVTKGLISQIENSRTIPSLFVLMQIIKAIEIDLDVFFSDLKLNNQEVPVLVFRKTDYTQKEDGLQLIFSRKIRNANVEFGVMEIPASSNSGSITFNALKIIFILKGTLKFQFINQIIELEEGEAMFTDGRIPHQIINEKKTANKLLFVQFQESKT